MDRIHNETINNLTHKIIGCAMKVHNTLGNGFQEVIYQRALAIELGKQNLDFKREMEMSIFYEDIEIGTRRVDFFVENKVMVELKAVEKLELVHKAQAINYCEAYNIADGLLINFGGTSLEFNRVYNKKIQHKMTETSQNRMTENGQNRMTETSQNRMTENGQNRMTETSQNRMTETSQNRMTENGQNRMTGFNDNQDLNNYMIKEKRKSCPSYHLQNPVPTIRMFILQKTELEKRWDPNTYQLERRNIIEALKKSGHQLEPLKFISIFKKSRVKEIPHSIPYLGLENIESHTGSYIPTSEKETISSAIEFKKGQVLFPKLRPYLNKVHFAEFDGVCSTEFHVLDSKKTSNEFLANFLRTNLVVNQTKYLMSGNTLPRLQTEDIESLLVPILAKQDEEKVNAIMKNALAQKQANEAEAEKLLASIDGYLLGELGIKLPEPPENTLKNRMFVTTLREISGGRFDPKLYSIQSKELIKSIYKTSFKYQTLKSVIIQSLSGDWGNDDKEVFNEDEFVHCLVIRATEFDNKFNLNVDGSRAKYRLINKTKYKALDIQSNDLLIEKSGGSENQPVGRISILTKELIDTYSLGFSNFVHKFRVNENVVNPEFVFNYLKTIHNIKITDFMQSQTNGIRNLILNEYLNLPIPVPPLEKQKEMADHITAIRLRAQQLKDQTKDLLRKANQEIESILLN